MDNEQDGLPERRVTVNQVVAWNMARWRKVAGLTQEELGESLGWTNTTVSAAERSWDGKRVRQFDADEIASIAGALGVPLIALFLPPDDDGTSVRYLLPASDADDEDASMADLFGLLVLDPEEPAIGDAWGNALGTASARYAAPELAAELLARLQDVTSEEKRAATLERVRWQRGALLAVVADLDAITEAMEEEGS